MNRYILLSIDVEEFDLPREYGKVIADKEALEVSLKGLVNFVDLIERHKITITIFTTAFFAIHNQSLMKSLSERHEIACHGYSHSDSSVNSELNAKKIIEDIIGRQLFGYRQPRLDKIDYSRLIKAGFTYDSSMNPTWIPGRYMNLFKPRLPFKNQNLWNLPISVSPIIRFPLFWLSFKNISEFIYRTLSEWTIDNDGYFNIYFHPWEFTDLRNYHIPLYIKKYSGREMLNRFERLILFMKDKGDFITSSQYIEKQLAHK